MKQPTTIHQSIVIAAALTAWGSTTFAQNVILEGKDSGIEISGQLLDFRDSVFIIRTDLGDLQVSEDTVNCIGAACPTNTVITYDLELAGPGEVAEVLLPIIADGFAADLDGEALLLDEDGDVIDEDEGEHEGEEHGGKLGLQLTSFEGEPIMRMGIQEAEGDEALALLATGEAAIVFTDDSAAHDMVDLIEESGGGNLETFEQERVIAVDGFAVIGHPDNNLPTLTMDQLAAIFGGTITNWSTIGGQDAAINLYSFADGSEPFHDLEELLLEPYGVELTDTANIVRTTRELTRGVSRDPMGIGIVSYSSTRGTRAIPLTNECGMIVPPTPFNIKTEEYPLGHRVFAYSRNDTSGYAADLLAFMDSPNLDGLVSKAGFVDLSVVPDDQTPAIARTEVAMSLNDDDYERVIYEEIIDGMNEHVRLSTTFRFDPGARRLDNKAQRDLQRIVSYFLENKPEDVLVVGFTDNKGNFDSNLNVAEDRAELVMNALIEAANGELGDVEIHTAGYGELAPVACNTTAKGRAINRRVEIWIEK